MHTRSGLTFSIAIAGLIGVLIVLAVLQYRWSGQVSQAERERVREDINRHTARFREGFYAELLQVCASFEIDEALSPEASGEEYIQRYRSWALTAARPGLVTGVYLWKAKRGQAAQVLRLDKTLQRFETAAWPAEFAEVHRRSLSQRFSDRRRGMPPPHFPPTWRLEEQVPALIHPIFLTASPEESGMSPPRFLGEVVLTLDLAVIQRKILPELARRSFAGPDGFLYQVAVVREGREPSVLYRSAPQASVNPASADAVMDALWGPLEPGERRSPEGRNEGRRNLGDDDLPQRRRSRPLQIIPAWEEPARWQLLVTHRLGSVSAAVAGIRRRNLAVSFGVLLLLAVSMAMVFVSASRARKLAKLQIEFVAGVSHELRTPLAVICSAADNLAAGAVVAGEPVRRYGALISTEGLKLSHMIQQILLFAAGQAHRSRYDLRPVQIDPIIERALAEARAAHGADEINVERSAEPCLPLVMADANALAHCLENLIGNALKYNGGNRWLRVCSQAARGPNGPEVQVTIEDRGIGVDPTETARIFEPFYRGRAAAVARCRGIGLGLSLAKGIAEAMGGRITVQSVVGKGSSFCLHLPAVGQSSSAGEVSAA